MYFVHVPILSQVVQFNKMKVSYMISIFLILLLGNMVSIFAIKSNSSAPHWETLDCQPGHKYLYSENKMTWPDARVEGELYLAYLFEI